ncbi:hypothetical protein JGH11_02685 [Dysgonomonas sp. Marseille-P4677]|uniref:SGNH/GDSL hydrolase family protein n=1 Tax=Dysgonomonas sp. Marseille-P4677 TaxID=2364790 RepID=UPI0019117109|nr:hypothetical protein [Dysgonomonas sp. Marseille-P4677]MBK5719774.1 hypothetical protein [Dysgonomonas sp. Marseille-P4677]
MRKNLIIFVYFILVGLLNSCSHKNTVSPSTDTPSITTNFPLILESKTVKEGEKVELPLVMCNHLWDISCKLTFESNGRIRIGKGRDIYQGSYVEIDSINIYVYTVTNPTSLVKTILHGIKIDKNLNIDISQKYNQTTINLTSNNESFSLVTDLFIGNDGIFVESLNGTYTVASLSFDAKTDCTKDILYIADSYGGASSVERIAGNLYIKKGVQSFMTSNFSGGNCYDLYALLKEAVRFSKPRYVIWGSGMNDNSFATWKSITEQAITLIEKSGAEPILITIPSVPTRDKTEINTYVRASGYRYIDFSLAVSDDAGNWFDGFLNQTDKVHPTEKGADALAKRFLEDFPELLN